MRERESSLLKWFLAFLLFAFVINIGVLVLIHEEPRRGIITFEMLKRWDFLQPTVLGEPYYKKPPFHNWVLALFSVVLGGVKELSLRLPSALSVALTSVAIYGFGKELFGRRTALFGSLIYPTFYIVLIGYGTKCEPDTLFTLLITVAGLGWLYFKEKGKELPAWLTGYFFTSLALLTKGLPAIQFFYALLTAYAFTLKRWRELFTKEHLLGALIGLSPFFGWLLAVKTDVAVKTLLSEVLSRAPGAGEFQLIKTLKKYISYPFRLITATFPWSFLLIFYWFKRRLNLELQPLHRVLAVAFLIDALIYWAFPGSRLRYLMPGLPLLALLSGHLLSEAQLIHKRAREILRFTIQLIVPVGIVAGVIVSKNPSLTLRETVIFVAFLYSLYFFFAPKFRITYIVVLTATLMLIFRAFYSSYYYPIAQLKYPPVRETAQQIARDSEGFKLYTKTKYLQLCFYVERARDEILYFNPRPPEESLFLSQKREGFVLKEYQLGKHRFYLCSYGVKSLPERRQSEEERGQQSPERRNRSKGKEESPQG